MEYTEPTQDERIMAALAHSSAVLFGMGIIAAVVIWATQKDESRYVAFQALQAVIYQLVGYAVFVAGMCCWLALASAMHITASVFINDDESGLHQDYEKWLAKVCSRLHPAPHAPIDHCRPRGRLHNGTGEGACLNGVTGWPMRI